MIVRQERRNLATIRAGEYEGLPKKLVDPHWKPDFGPAAFNPKTGATAIGARKFLVAYNVNLNVTDTRLANRVAFDVRERGRWNDYMHAYEELIRHTATPHAPWYVVPADAKWFTRLVVASAIVDALTGLDLHYPVVPPAQRRELAKARRALLAERRRR